MDSRLAAITLILLTIIGCAHTSQKLGDSEEIHNYFSDQEILDLQKVVTFFEVYVCESAGLNRSHFSECYNTYFERMHADIPSGHVDFQIPVDEQQFLLEGLDSSTFNKVWGYCKIWTKHTDTLQAFCLKPSSNYTEFLRAFGRKNHKAMQYGTTLETTGGMSPSIFADVIINHREYDIKDERVKLILAIHCLTANEDQRISKLVDSHDSKL